MSKKNDKNDKLNEQDELDPMETNPQETESTSGGYEAGAPVINLTEAESVQSEVSDDEPEGNLSPDDLLDDVRRSLIMDVAEKAQAEQTKWWKRIGKGSKRKDNVDAPPVIEKMPVETSEPVTSDGSQDEYIEQLDELIDMLEEETQEDVVVKDTIAVPGEETVSEEQQQEQKIVDLDELKKRAFRPRTTPDEEERSLSEVRSVALDDGEEVFIEIEAKTEDPMRDRIKAIENALVPYRRHFYFISVFISIVMVLLVSASLYRVYVRSLPPPPTEEAMDLPFPVGMTLPGGLEFGLGKGRLQEGRWDPRGPEWLVGTEVCRWVAIPYSRQLEAVVRTLTRDDQIKLTMSNNDILVYNVFSINQLSDDEMQKLDSSSPCLLLVLAQSGTDERWVVTAIP